MRTFFRLTVFYLMFASGPSAADDLLLKHAQLVDPVVRKITVTDILIANGRISAIANAPAVAAEVLDLHGKWVIPGLIDLHVHFSGNPRPDGERENFDLRGTARLMLYCGVTAFLDLAANSPETIFSVRDQQRANPVVAAGEADIYGAGVALGNWNLDGPATAPRRIERYIQRWKPDVIKFIYDDARGRSTLDRATFLAALAAVQRAGVKSVVHIGTWDNALDAINAGATAVTHLFDDQPIPESLVQLWSHRATVSIPTMAVQSDLANFVHQPTLLDNPLLRAVAASASINAVRDIEHYSAQARATVHWQERDRNNDFQTLAKLVAAGVTVLAGSDTNNLGTFQGFSLHRELKLLQEGGVLPWGVLAAATTHAATFLGRPSGIQPGDIAELVILDGDPLVDISNTQRIFGVVHHGRLVDRNGLLKEAR